MAPPLPPFVVLRILASEHGPLFGEVAVEIVDKALSSGEIGMDAVRTRIFGAPAPTPNWQPPRITKQQLRTPEGIGRLMQAVIDGFAELPMHYRQLVAQGSAIKVWMSRTASTATQRTPLVLSKL
jgi:hypothetical protein